ncbi:hypothetical protein Clacol_010004 [Clathrus columnatus]|uniref:Cytochrome P450 n=1 Tax=Clathrus columnatus TaxID=1419009 RepID=A0AAV5ATS1_9AGAM|nr:hypothetical protein Clacol_010004 [Clathrus columnatus]
MATAPFDTNPAAHLDFEEYLKIVSASCYIAGIDPTDSILLQSLFMMLLHPEVQKRAHELDKVVGPDYLPFLDDKKNSPSLLRSKSVYGNEADEFKPERFLDPNMPFPEPAFGFGRRHLGENSVFIFIACILHTYRIFPFEDENGEEEPPKAEDYDSGLVLRPKPFKCRIVPRSPSAVKIVEGLSY